MNICVNGRSDIKEVHFIGIGGISMSSLGEILHHEGYAVTGSDIKESPITKRLSDKGIDIMYPQSADNIQNPDLVVYTAAIGNDNPELMMAREKGILTVDRSVFLGSVMKCYNKSIVVSGTHGKTTTTAMVSVIMLQAQLNPTIHLGGLLDNIKGNTNLGNKDYFISEGCEYVESFLNFYPDIAIILNVEEDHLDYYKDIDHIMSSFKKYMQNISPDGILVVNGDNENAVEAAKACNSAVKTYGIENQYAEFYASNVTFTNDGKSHFDLLHSGNLITNITLNVPGIYNVSNAVAAAVTCLCAGVYPDDIKAGLANFNGTHRRFEIKGEKNGVKIIDDYAHHPTEIMSTLKAAKDSYKRKIICVFQPHTYTRTKALFKDFATSFGDCDELILLDIYSASREKDPGDISSLMLAEAVSNTNVPVCHMESFDKALEYLNKKTAPNDIVITMGAGDVYLLGESYLL